MCSALIGGRQERFPFELADLDYGIACSISIGANLSRRIPVAPKGSLTMLRLRNMHAYMCMNALGIYGPNRRSLGRSLASWGTPALACSKAHMSGWRQENLTTR